MQEHVPPFNYIFPKVDISNPRTFLWIKRGILQYTVLKPFLALATIIMKATAVFEDGYIGLQSGYFWSGLLYNLSVTISLYSLGFFWLCLYWDLKPFRPVPKVPSISLPRFPQSNSLLLGACRMLTQTVSDGQIGHFRLLLARVLSLNFALLQRPPLQRHLHSRQSSPRDPRRPNLFRNAPVRRSSLVCVLPCRFPRLHSLHGPSPRFVRLPRRIWPP